MTEIRAIEVEMHYTPSGDHTCAITGKHCIFLGAKRYGTHEICMINGEYLNRKNENGRYTWLMPHSDCIVATAKPKQEN